MSNQQTWQANRNSVRKLCAPQNRIVHNTYFYLRNHTKGYSYKLNWRNPTIEKLHASPNKERLFKIYHDKTKVKQSTCDNFVRIWCASRAHTVRTICAQTFQITKWKVQQSSIIIVVPLFGYYHSNRFLSPFKCRLNAI